MPASLWSGNLRLSLVLIPVKLHSAVSTEDAISFRMIHEPSGQPIRYVKGIPTDNGFEEVPEGEIIKGYEHSKGQHVLLRSEEIDDLKLEAKHTIDMVRFADAAEVDSRYWEKPYYLTADGDDADEGYTVIREPSSRPGRWPSVGWSWEVEAIWSTSKRMAKRDLCFPSFAMHRSSAMKLPTST